MQFLVDHWSVISTRFGEHLRLVTVSLVIALAFAIPIGILLSRFRRLETPVLSVLSILYTVPSLALLVLLIPFVGLGTVNATIVLVVYAQIILVRNIVVGLRGIDPGILEAARGMGMSDWQRLLKIEMPLALPVMLAGVRIAVVTLVGIGTVAALVHGGGLGELLFDGVSRDYPQLIFAGAGGAALLAGIANIGLRFVEQRVGRIVYGDA
ncbi:MAG: hypothetical protein NVS4B8_01790 [Herpetosiphon sp.]